MIKIDTIDFNLELRGKVLEDSLNLEKLASDVIKSVLRIFKDQTKTLGNKSSSLSFKNKIDLLFDIGELDKDKFDHLVKFMEIRNQFIHNHECNSFDDLVKINSELTNYLIKNFSDGLKGKEFDLFGGYLKLYLTCLGNLYILDREYNWGIEGDFRKHISEKILNNFDELTEKAVERFDIAKKEETFAVSYNTSKKQIDLFIEVLKMEIKFKEIEVLKELELDHNVIYKRKIDISQKIKGQ